MSALARGDQAQVDKHVALAEIAAGDDFPTALRTCKAMGKPFSIPANRIDSLLSRVVNVGGPTAMGLDPASVKKIIVAHSHGDHYGGAVYLQEQTGAEIVMSDADWKELEKPMLQYESKRWGEIPERFASMMRSAERVAAKAKTEGIDVFLSNHPGLDGTLKKIHLIDSREAGVKHPMVIGTDGVARFMTALRECVAARLASFAPQAVPAH